MREITVGEVFASAEEMLAGIMKGANDGNQQGATGDIGLPEMQG